SMSVPNSTVRPQDTGIGGLGTVTGRREISPPEPMFVVTRLIGSAGPSRPRFRRADRMNAVTTNARVRRRQRAVLPIRGFAFLSERVSDRLADHFVAAAVHVAAGVGIDRRGDVGEEGGQVVEVDPLLAEFDSRLPQSRVAFPDRLA